MTPRRPSDDPPETAPTTRPAITNPARLDFTSAQHAMFAEMLLMDRGCRWYRSVSDRIAAAGVHAQLSWVLLMAAEQASEDFDMDGLRYEWAHALAVRGPADSADVELAVLLDEGRDR